MVFLIILGVLVALLAEVVAPALIPSLAPAGTLTAGLELAVLVPLIRVAGGLMAASLVFYGLMTVLLQRADQERLRRQTGIESIRKLSWQAFERLLGEAYRRQGYAVRILGGGGADGGVDLDLRKDGKRLLVQAKHWKTKVVPVMPLRELWGVVADVGADGAIFIASGRFTVDAQRWAANKNLRLIEGQQLAEMIGAIQRGVASPVEPNQKEVHTVVPVAPNQKEGRVCAKCGELMVMRTAKRGVHAGEQFWGCSDYPTCRYAEPA